MSIEYETIITDEGDEIFKSYGGTWNITKLQKYLERSSEYRYTLDKDFYEHLIRDDQTVDESKIDNVDLQVPIIVAQLNNHRYLLIDGIHRVRKAKKNNMECMHAYVVPFEIHVKFLKTRWDFDLITGVFGNFS